MKVFPEAGKPTPIDRVEALACIPVVLPNVTSHQTAAGDIIIEYPLVVKPFLKAIFKRFNRGTQQELKRKLQLDALGSKVWQSIDGEKGVKDIIDDFAADSGITRHEAELSVSTFLRELGKRGLIMLQ